MEIKTHSILGISPGTKTMGIAVMKENELLVAVTKNFDGTWSKEKRKNILKVIEKYSVKYQVKVVAIKVNHASRSSKGLIELINAIRKFSAKQSLLHFEYSIEELKQFNFPNVKANKESLLKSMVDIHQELLSEYTKEMRNKDGYYLKLFEAVACAKVAEKSK